MKRWAFWIALVIVALAAVAFFLYSREVWGFLPAVGFGIWGAKRTWTKKKRVDKAKGHAKAEADNAIKEVRKAASPDTYDRGPSPDDGAGVFDKALDGVGNDK